MPVPAPPHVAVAVISSTGSPAAPNAAEDRTRLKQAEQLYKEGRWKDVVQITIPRPGDPASIDYYRGMALAKLKRWTEARQAFERGRRKAPRDERFSTELAGLAFLKKNYSEAKANLNQALRINPHDAYAINFLATIYDLEDNIDAALKYWNRIQMPYVESIHFEPLPLLDPVLLNHVFAFSSESHLDRSALRTTQARLRAFGIFPHPKFELQPLINGQFNAQFNSSERNGWGDSTFQGLVSLLRGVPYDTAYPEFFNIHHRAMNFTSLVRWDPQKERVSASFSSPIEESAQWRYRVYVDGRRENWNLTRTFFGSSAPVNNLQLEKVEGGAELESIASGRLQWNTGLDFSGRSFRNAPGSDPSAAPFFRNGFSLESRSRVNYQLLDFPERRFTIESIGQLQAGKFFAHSANSFLQTEGGLLMQWFPKAQGDDYAMTGQIRAGHSWGSVPFDDLFILGLERDNDLWLRAHIGTADGRKGSAPLGRDYVLFNWDDFKNVYRNGFFNIRLGPFLDSGRISDPSGDFGSRRWLLDTGLELKIQVLGGAEVEFFFGKDLRTGRNAFYGATSRPE